MAPLPPNNTKRYFLDYTVCTKQHTLEMRVSNDTDDSAASDAFEAAFTAVGPALFATTIDGMRVQEEGADITLPATYSGALSFGTGAGTPADTAGYVDFIGRSSGGRRWRAAFFGSTHASSGGDWRASPGEVSEFDACRAAINGLTDQFLAIDGVKPVLYNYADTGYNAYWRNKIR